MTDCDLHIILCVPIGTFTRGSLGVRPNIPFFRKGQPTEEVRIYDLLGNVEKLTKGHPLTAESFKDFESRYQPKPRGKNDRSKRFTRDEITKRDDKLDLSWLKDESPGDPEDLPEPEDLVSEAVT